MSKNNLVDGFNMRSPNIQNNSKLTSGCFSFVPFRIVGKAVVLVTLCINKPISFATVVLAEA